MADHMTAEQLRAAVRVALFDSGIEFDEDADEALLLPFFEAGMRSHGPLIEHITMPVHEFMPALRAFAARLSGMAADTAEEWTPTVADIPEQLMAAKRIHVGRCDAFDDWFVGWGKSEDCHIEGTANHWFWLAYLILGLVKESDRPYNEDKPLPFSPQHIRERLGITSAPAAPEHPHV